MRTELYNFFFHPLHNSHSKEKKRAAFATNLALTILSVGSYLLLFGCVHLRERYIKKRSPNKKMQRAVAPILKKTKPAASTTRPIKLEKRVETSLTNPDFVGVSSLKNKQKETLEKLEKLVKQEEWGNLQTHGSFGFDWWMFPIMRESASYGRQYELTPADVETLKKDPEFMKNYHRGAILVALSWGWDLENSKLVTNEKQKWVGYSVRLGKMADSLKLFGKTELHTKLRTCAQESNVYETLPSWVQNHLQSL